MIPIIYNLFPTLAGPISRWMPHAQRAREMGFNWLYLNPIQYPGFSGSLYAIKEYDRLHPELETAESGSSVDALVPVIRSIRALGLSVMMDLVINHTAKDSPLVTSHPNWFRRDARGAVLSPSAIDPADARKITVWGDLAAVDNDGTADREGLWGFWDAQVHRALDLGFTGFRCDAAYKVPAALWQRLIRSARRRAPETVFVAETLGCRLEETAAAAAAGFDYLYNSSKWWDFREPWCLTQHEQFRRVAPSISFPESHDTPRLAAETGGSEALQRQRYAFAAAFSGGVQTTIGYEFGFRRPLDVVKTRPSDWEEPAFDLARVIRRLNHLKQTHPLLASEGVLRRLDAGADAVTVIQRWSDERGTHRGRILINRDPGAGHDVWIDRAELSSASRLVTPCRDDTPEKGVPVPDRIRLGPAEVALVLDRVSGTATDR